jgi:methionine aminopeptidase, type I
MIEYKSQREIDLMKEAGRIVALCHEELKTFIKAGVSANEIDALVEKIILAHDATPSFKGYEGYPATTNVCINDVVVHGIPDNSILKDGDIVTVDIGACYKGFHGDSGWTYAVGKVDAQKQKLMQVTKDALFNAIEIIGPGTHLRDVSRTIQQYVEGHGLSIVKELAGHGLGRSLHEDPMVLNYDSGLGDLVFKPGLVIAVEPIVAAGSPRVELLDDDWTVVTVDGSPAAQYEHTIAITKTGCEILTKI